MAPLTKVTSSNVDQVGKSGDDLRVIFHNGGVYDYKGAAENLRYISLQGPRANICTGL